MIILPQLKKPHCQRCSKESNVLTKCVLINKRWKATTWLCDDCMKDFILLCPYSKRIERGCKYASRKQNKP